MSSASKSWGSTTGGSNDKADFLKFNNGITRVRIVSNILPRYVYWIQNKEGNVAPFECLRFNRLKESFVRGKSDPVHDMGFYEKEKKDGENVLLKPKKNYIAFVIDRSDNKLKVMEVKATILKGIQSIMKQLKLADPFDIDISIEKKGKGFDTEYDVQQIAAMQFQMALKDSSSEEAKRHQADIEEILGDAIADEDGDFLKFEKVPSLDELYPVQSYDEQKQAIESWLEGKKDEKEDKGSKSEATVTHDQEAVNELDD